MHIAAFFNLQHAAVPRKIVLGELSVKCVTIKVGITDFPLLFKTVHKPLQGKNNISSWSDFFFFLTVSKTSICFYNLKSNMYLQCQSRRHTFHCSLKGSACREKNILNHTESLITHFPHKIRIHKKIKSTN